LGEEVVLGLFFSQGEDGLIVEWGGWHGGYI
jgi:hypothetical protein